MTETSFAKKVVRTCLRIGKEDRVCIFSWKHMLDLAEAFTLECRRAGAETHLEITTDELYYDTILNLPREYLRKTNPFGLALLDVTTANIFISGPENPERLKLITPERMNAMVEADKPFNDKFLEKRIKSAHVNSGYVTPQRAKTYGFDYDEWKENMKAAIDVEYEQMRELGRRIGNVLEKASEAHIRTDNGTDLKLELEKRPSHVSDGVVDDEDLAKGAAFTALPAGDVAVALKESSANGTFISNIPEPDTGVLVRNLSLAFKDGGLTSFGGGQNIELLKTRYERARGDKHQASWLAIGLNPRAQNGYTYNQIVKGNITLGVGDNREFGGKIESTFQIRCTIAESDLELDGQPIIRRGKFVV